MNWIRERFQQFDQQLVSVTDYGFVTYAEFEQKIETWRVAIQQWNICAGDRIGLIADYHIDVVALLQALMEHSCIVIPLSEDDRSLITERLDIACATKLITVTDAQVINADTVTCSHYAAHPPHSLMLPMLARGEGGFVIYTSGSTGKSKAVLLEYSRIINKYREKVRSSYRTLLFLKLDHIGGLNTLFAVIFNGGTIVTSASRQARDICRSIQQHKIELLPTTPSFLTMLLISRMHESYDLSSLKVVTYGTEVMPASILERLHQTFPLVVLKQTYGLSELGILPTQSKDSSSKWMKIGGAGFDIKVKDNVLWIKSDQAMLGYLNATSPFDEDGWYNTGDKVEVDGEYFRILGRESEIINVGGEKVFPMEIESYLLTLDNVKDVVVRGKASPVTGQIIVADIVLARDEDPSSFKKRIMDQCRDYLPAFKVPGLITIANHGDVVGSRFKKIRNPKARVSC